MDEFFLQGRSLFRRSEIRRARRLHAALVRGLDAAQREELQRFVEMMCTRPAEGRVVLARAHDLDGQPFWAGLPIETLLALHAWVSGATGAGKSFFALALLLQVLRDGRNPVILLDMKGELSSLLIGIVLPVLAMLPGGMELVRNLRIIRPFDAEYLPLLRITQPEESIPREIQAFNLAAALEEALADDLGARMNRVFLRLVLLAIELNEPLTVLARWLEHPIEFQRAARRSADPGVRAYAAALARESRASIDALLARLDTFLFLPTTKLCLSAPRCVSFHDALESGVTIIDLGDPPAGAERVARFWAGILMGRLTRAILSRQLSPNSRPVWVIFEEFQEALGRHQVEQFGRLLALARFKRVALWFLNQQPSQVAAVDSGLVKLLRTNTGLEAAFRCSFEDARSFAHALPVPDGVVSAAVKRAELTQEMARLPDRTFYLWLKQAPFRAQKVRSPRLDLERLRAQARAVPDAVREAIRRGTVAAPRAELEAAAASDRQEPDVPGAVHELLRPEATDNDSNLPGLG